MIFWYTLKWKSNQIGLNVSVETSDSRDNRAEGPRNQFKEYWGSPCFQEQSPRAVHPSEGSWWCWHDVALWITASSPLWCQSRLTSAQQAVTMHDGPRQLQALLTSPPALQMRSCNHSCAWQQPSTDAFIPSSDEITQHQQFLALVPNVSRMSEIYHLHHSKICSGLVHEGLRPSSQILLIPPKPPYLRAAYCQKSWWCCYFFPSR